MIIRILLIVGIANCLFGATPVKTKAKSKPKFQTEAKGKVKGKPEIKPELPPQPQVQPKELAPVIIAPLPKVYRYKFNTGLGLGVLQGSALASTMQFGIAPATGSPFYIGPEVNFSLFSPGSLLGILGGVSYDFYFGGSPRLGLSVGGVGGVAFTSGLAQIHTTVFQTFLEVAFLQELDDLVSIRAELKPGFVESYFAFMMNFLISFRFL